MKGTRGGVTCKSTFVPSKDTTVSQLRVPNEDPKEVKFKKVLGHITGLCDIMGSCWRHKDNKQHKTVSFQTT